MTNTHRLKEELLHPAKKTPRAPSPQKQVLATSTDNPEDPTDNPQDPQAGDNPGLEEYVGSYMQAAQDWFDNVQEMRVMHTWSFTTLC